jgi:ABC-type branched-subunit amino acid transport system ATPase component
MPAAIETDNLSIRYGDVLAVHRASIRVNEGEIFGYLGPNVFTRSGAVWTEQQRLTANDGSIIDFWGTDSALSPDGGGGVIGTSRLYQAITTGRSRSSLRGQPI